MQVDEGKQQKSRGTESYRHHGGGSGLGEQVTKDGGATLDFKKRIALAYMQASTGSTRSGAQETSTGGQSQRFSRR